MKNFQQLGRTLLAEEQKALKGGVFASFGGVCTITTITNGTKSFETVVFSGGPGCPGLSGAGNNYCVDLVINTPVDRCFYNCGC